MIRNLKERLIRFLRWTERYTKTDMVYFFKGNLWLNINKVLSIGNGLVLSFAFAHLLTKEAYGTYTYVFALTGLFSMPVATGLGAGLSKSIPRGNDSSLFEGLHKILPWSIGFGALLAGLGGYYLIAHNFTLGIACILGGVIIPVGTPFGIAKTFLNLKGDFKLTTMYSSWRTPIMAVALVATALISPHALSIILVTMIGNLVLSAIFYFHVRRIYGFKSEVKPESKTEPFSSRYAFHAGFLSIFGYLNDQIDDLLLWRFVGAAPVATYTFAMAPVLQLRSLVDNQSTIAVPKLAQKDFSEVKKTIAFRIRQLYFIAVPLAILYIIAAPYIYHLLFPRYVDSVILSQFAVLSLLTAPRRLMTAAIVAHQKVKQSYVTNILPNAIRIALACILVPIFGISGAVVALLSAEAVDYIVLGALMRYSK